MQKIILIAGPTGSGKSEIALRLAKKINGEIINADSMQVYKEIKILSARPENYFNITHYLYGSISIRNNFSAGEWLKKAQLNVKKIINKKKQPIFVGGTGLYFKLLTEGNPKNIFLLKLLRLRLKKMFEQGAVDEVKKFIKLKIDPNLPANKILGIEEINKYLGKKISLEQSFEETFIRTRRYVKRQRTWFRGHMKDWISIFHPNFEILTKKIINLVTSS